MDTGYDVGGWDRKEVRQDQEMDRTDYPKLQQPDVGFGEFGNSWNLRTFERRIRYRGYDTESMLRIEESRKKPSDNMSNSGLGHQTNGIRETTMRQTEIT